MYWDFNIPKHLLQNIVMMRIIFALIGATSLGDFPISRDPFPTGITFTLDSLPQDAVRLKVSPFG